MTRKVCTALCNCGGTLTNINWDEVKRFMEERQSNDDGDFVIYSENLCSRKAQAELYDKFVREKPQMIAFGIYWQYSTNPSCAKQVFAIRCIWNVVPSVCLV